MFSHSIGVSLALGLGRFEEAEPFLAEALLKGTFSLLNVVAGYVPLFCARGDYAAAREILTWGGALLKGLKKDGATDALDKTCVIWDVLQAHIEAQTGQEEAARACLEQAVQRAARFDGAVDYSLNSLRFMDFPENSLVFDSLGETALDTLETTVRLMKDPKLTALWKEMQDNE